MKRLRKSRKQHGMASDRKTAPVSVRTPEAHGREEAARMQTTVAQTSWWAGQAQASRETFTAALAQQLPRMLADKSPEARYVDAAITAQWSIGFPRRSSAALPRRER